MPITLQSRQRKTTHYTNRFTINRRRKNFLAHGNGWNSTEIGSRYDRKILEPSQGDIQSEFNHGFHDVQQYAAKLSNKTESQDKRGHTNLRNRTTAILYHL